MESDGRLSLSGVTTGDQFEEALGMAEAIMKQANREQEKAGRLLTAEIGTVTIAVAVAAIIAILGFSSGVLTRVLVLIIGGFAGIIVAGTMQITVRARL